MNTEKVKEIVNDFLSKKEIELVREVKKRTENNRFSVFIKQEVKFINSDWHTRIYVEIYDDKLEYNHFNYTTVVDMVLIYKISGIVLYLMQEGYKQPLIDYAIDLIEKSK